MEGNRESIIGGWINGNMVRRHHHGLGEICDIDITNELKFGQYNTIVLPPLEIAPNKVLSWDIRKISIDLYRAECSAK